MFLPCGHENEDTEFFLQKTGEPHEEQIRLWGCSQDLPFVLWKD